MKTGVAHLPLHGGKAPRWLFERMKKLARQITLMIVEEYGPREMLERLSDPFWFQAFGCVLGFDWHSSGLTTTVGGALKEGLRGIEKETGFFVGGGKGAVSRKTPLEIESWCQKLALDPAPLVYASRMSAKVDSAALQDGFQLYHHNFFFTDDGQWCVVQQGMNGETRYARRYHWQGRADLDFACEPHSAVCSDFRGSVLNLVAREGRDCREASVRLACDVPARVVPEIRKCEELFLPSRHEIRVPLDIDPKRLYRVLLKTYECQPRNFEALLGMEGVGAKTLRALSLISELVHGARPSFRDPVRYSFAHGGKDGHPYPVDREVYDRSIRILKTALDKARLEHSERLAAFKRLALWLV